MQFEYLGEFETVNTMQLNITVNDNDKIKITMFLDATA